ncbi:kinetochore-associated Ndc80 complex subunit spc25 [Dispira simplex]|nr:kinetochore-associated Ndc80 complex subunit spc25 [Dispira simplex]
MAMTPLFSRTALVTPDLEQEASSPFTTTDISEPNFPSEQLKESIARFTEQFDRYVTQKKQVMTEKRLVWQKARAENREKYATLNEKLAVYQQKRDDIVKDVKREAQEVETVRNALSQLNIKHEELERNKALLQAQVDDLQRRVQRKEEALAAKEKEVLRQQSKNKPELQLFQRKLGLTISTEKPDVIAFTFTRIAAKDWSQPFHFAIDVTEKHYQVPTCNPMVPQLEDHLAWLNRTRDFYGFLKRMRQAFVEYTLHHP